MALAMMLILSTLVVSQTRMKNELKAAKGFEPAEDEEEDVKPGSKPSTVYGDEIKRLVRKVDKAGVYDSEEEEENPYIVCFLFAF